MNKAFCLHCNNEVSYHVIKETIKEYKGYEVDILQNIGVCNICNEKIYVSDLSHEENGWIFTQNGELISTGFKNRIKIKTKHTIFSQIGAFLFFILNKKKMKKMVYHSIFCN